MSEFSAQDFPALLRPEGFSCSCGKKHAAPVSFLAICKGAIQKLPQALGEVGMKRPMVICGPHGYEAAGRQVCEILSKAAVPFHLHVIEETGGKRIKPAERAVGSAVLNLDHNCDSVIAVGSGVINDIGKVLSASVGVPLLTVATAPSMDGYASDSSSMEVGGIKLSLYETMPSAIICDLDIIGKAPMHMIHAGLGDILAKYTSLCDWKLSSIVTGEYYCPNVASLVNESLESTVRAAPGVAKRDAECIESITAGLVLSGLCISFAGFSHPASGLEHYFSHCWEMMCLERGQDYELHGIQVGVGMLLTLRIIERLKTIRPDIEHAKAAAQSFDRAAWEANIRRVFPRAAAGILTIEEKARKNDVEGRLLRARRAIEHWDEILRLFDTLPGYAEAEALMLSVGMPTRAGELGLSNDDVADAFVLSRDIRDKYLLSSMIWDLGYMDDFAQWLRRG